MKRFAIAAAAVLAMLGSAHAQQFSMGNAYGELGYTFLKLKGDDFSASPGAIRGILGYEFHPNFAGEFMLMGGVSDDSVNGFDPAVGGAFRADVKLQNAYGFYLKPKYNINNQFELFGRLGWARTKVKVDATAPIGSGSTSDSDSDFSYGVGLNYMFNPRMGAGLDYMRYFDKDGGKIDGWTVSFRYKF